MSCSFVSVCEGGHLYGQTLDKDTVLLEFVRLTKNTPLQTICTRIREPDNDEI